MNFLFIISGLVLLILGGNWLLKSSISISLGLKIPKIIIGMTGDNLLIFEGFVKHYLPK